MTGEDVDLLQFVHPDEFTADLARELVSCWIAVTNAGGAAGFPFPPVDATDVAPVARQIIADLHPRRSRLLLAFLGEALAGWVSLRRDPNPLTAHWGTVSHLAPDDDRDEILMLLKPL